MLNRPHARDLIELARDTLRSQLAPGLSDEARYQALMAANALSIALRELDGDDDAVEREALLLLYGNGLDPGSSLHEMNTRLARDIRRGEFDGAVEYGLRRLLRAQVLARLRVSNPRRVAP